MTLDSESFLQLCQKLRKLGATRVEAFGFSAEFGPKVAPAQPVPTVAYAQVPQRALSRVPPSSRSPLPVPERLTPELIEELKEQAYARELGR